MSWSFIYAYIVISKYNVFLFTGQFPWLQRCDGMPVILKYCIPSMTLILIYTTVHTPCLQSCRVLWQCDPGQSHPMLLPTHQGLHHLLVTHGDRISAPSNRRLSHSGKQEYHKVLTQYFNEVDNHLCDFCLFTVYDINFIYFMSCIPTGVNVGQLEVVPAVICSLSGCGIVY